MNQSNQKNKILLAVAVFAVFAAGLLVAPRVKNDLRAEVNNCSNAPQVATLNPFGLTSPGEMAGTNCHDYPLVSVRNVNSAAFSYQMDDSGQVGDQFLVRIYVHNGAATNPELAAQTTANNVTGNFSLHGGVILASASGSNTNSISGSASIQIPSGAHLEIVPGSQQITDNNGSGVGGSYVNFSQNGGNFGFGNMPACFEYSRFIVFTVRVVGQTSQNPSGDISANLDGQVAGQCLYYARVRWETQNADPVRVTVKDITDQSSENDMAYASNSQAGGDRVDYITPGHNYQFNLYIQGGSTAFRTAYLDAPALNCGGNPGNPSGNISFSLGNDIGQCQMTGNVSWSTQNVQTTLVTVDDLSDNLAANNISNATSGNEPTPWLNSGHRYVFVLYNADTNQELHRTNEILIPQTSSCVNTTPTPTPTPTPVNPVVCQPGNQSVTTSQSVFFNATGGSGSYTWSAIGGNNSHGNGSQFGTSFSNAGNYTVYVMDAANNSRQATCSVNVSSTFNPPFNPPTNLVCPSGSVSLSPSVINQGQSATAFAPSGWHSGRFVSSNTNVVTVNGSTITATYISIGSTTVTGQGWTAPNGATNCPLSWSAITVQREPGPSACVQRTFNTNSSGIYSGGSKVNTLTPNQQYNIKCDYGVVSGYITLDSDFSQPCGFVGFEGTAANFSCTAPANPGTYSVYCRMSNNAAADNSCSSANLAGTFTINSVTPPALSCNTLTPSVSVNQTASFTASGGTGAYTWSNGGSPSSGSGSSFNTTFSSAGNKFVTVQSGSQTVNCPVVTVIQPQPSQVFCELISGSSVVNLNDVVTFRASGGNGTYAFNASTGNPSSRGASSVNTFSTQYSTAGSKTVNVISDGQIANCPIVTVSQPTQVLSCVALTPNVNVGQLASFNATGGNGSYSWSGGGNPSSGSGANFSTIYNTSGSRNVTVQSGSQTAVCGVNVAEIVIPDVVCAPGSQNASINQTVYFAASGGNGQFTWSAPNSSNQSGSSSGFNTSYSSSGSKTVTVSSAGKSAVCNVNVQQIPQQTLVCNVLTPNVNIGQSAAFSATGGTAPYNWLTSNSSHNSGTGMTFTTTYNTSGVRGVTLSSADGQTVICYVNVSEVIPTPTPTPTPTPPSNGNCNNSTNSCNNNTNTNNQTSTGNNSANQNNQSNINGNNNTVTQTNNNCVNNSCNNIVYIQQGSTVPANEYRQLSIEKLVRNVNSGQYQNFQNSVSANVNDVVEFQIVVRSTGNQTVNNVRLSDTLPSGLTWVSGQINGEVSLGTLFANDSRTVTFQARVNSGNTNPSTTWGTGQGIQNIARVSGDGVGQIQDDAWVFVNSGCTYNCGQPGSVNLSYSKKAINDTKNADATSVLAGREDFITYTLTVTNTGSVVANSFVITDDLSQVLPYADIVDNGGGSLSGNVLTFPAISVPAGGNVSKSFRVRVKYGLAPNLSYTMTNTYGNTVTIRINNPQVLGAFVAPKTGADTLGMTFAALLTLSFAAFKKRELLNKLILNN